MSEATDLPLVPELAEHRLGQVTLEPQAPIVAGEYGEWTLTLKVGSFGIDEGGTIKIARRFASDWARPQFDDPKAEGFTRVETDGDARLRPRYDPKAHVRPWMKCVVIDVYDGSLAPGDVVRVVFGDRSQGGPGIRAQSFIERRHEMRVLVDPTNACLVRRVPSSPVLEIVAGEASGLNVVVPSQVRPGQPFKVAIDGVDRWGNPTAAPAGVGLAFHGDGQFDLGQADANGHIEARCVVAGSGYFEAEYNGQKFRSNPLRSTSAGPSHYWCDLHAQSDATVGTGTEHEYFEFGRRFAHLDVMSHQGNDFQMSTKDWQRLGEVVREVHRDGEFVVFPGFEWSANSTAGGDRNVIYLDDDQPIFRSSHWQVPEVAEDARSPAHPADQLFDRLAQHVDPERSLVAAHCGGRYADIRLYHDERFERLVELSSCWGVFEWLLWDAYDCGYRVGVMCNSDGHKGRPGFEGPGAGQFGIFGGLTCVIADNLSREAVFEALRARRCYGTTGPRLLLEVDVDGQPMGSEINASGPVRVRAQVQASSPIAALEVFKGRELVHRQRPQRFAELESGTPRRLRLSWGGARIRGRGRRATWDGEIRVEGCEIRNAATFAFDSPMDGILERDRQSLRLRSRTTGDIDGIDLWLDDASRGRLSFVSETGTLAVDLAELGQQPHRHDFGGLDLHASVERFPEKLDELSLSLDLEVEPSAGACTPIMIRAVQEDGHMAWTSPVYVDRS